MTDCKQRKSTYYHKPRMAMITVDDLDEIAAESRRLREACVSAIKYVESKRMDYFEHPYTKQEEALLKKLRTATE